MKKIFSHHTKLFPFAYGWISALSILVLFSLYGSYRYKAVSERLAFIEAELASTTEALHQSVQELTGALSLAEQENTGLKQNLTVEQIKNNSYAQQIQSISSTVGDLYKLSQTDRELLQKYSKVYFLSENYIPSSLSDISTTYLERPEKPEKIHTTIKPYLEALVNDARAQNIPLSVLSGYRSFDTQESLKSQYTVRYGAGTANTFSADQGYSEHQLGSTVDFTTPQTKSNLNAFEKTSAYPWLLENAHRYGFIISYPKGNTFYQFEPWHWRFVGVEFATKLYTEKKNFYDLDQREINAYLGKIFN